MSQHDTPHILAAIESMRGTLVLARTLVESGRKVNLGGLDAGTAALCAAVGMLPPGEARSLRPALLGLLAALDGLGIALATP
ncbi:hypothetical protein [Roseicella aquatilis]|uniref:Uncharacterized protein n=1 Tax=Roseicella aquatilis TaxID=2527868 RepID=A0A4R4DP96_9PROT|nr:hypothetical protein [Roseicella aquatilis]TCZ63649.1 hypothetical protein EXY23_09700 [Roseicella aquatilis]